MAKKNLQNALNALYKAGEDYDFPEAPTPQAVPSSAPTPSPLAGAQDALNRAVEAGPQPEGGGGAAPPTPMGGAQDALNKAIEAAGAWPEQRSPISPLGGAQMALDKVLGLTPEKAVPSGTPGSAGGEGNCPPGTVYRTDKAGALDSGKPGCEPEDWRSKNDKDTCLDAPPDCGDGYEPWCDFTTATWKCGFTGAGGGGGGGAAKGGAAGPAKAAGGGSASGGGAGANAFDAYLQQFIRQALESPSRYTPQALQALYGEITRQASGQITRGQRDVRNEAARKGMSRAGATTAALRSVRDAAERQRGQSIVGVQTAKINADYQDKVGAIDRAQRYLDSLRDSEYRWALMSEQRKQFDANLALAYANLAQQRSMLQAQLQSQWDMLRSNQGFYALMQGV